MKADNILLPQLYHKKKRPEKKPTPGRGKGLVKIIMSLLVVAMVIGTLFMFADAGGNIALSIAKDSLSKNYGIDLTAEKITGNPIRGYTLHNFALTDKTDNREIFSASYLSAKINLTALLTGNLRLAEISLGGISLDISDMAGGDSYDRTAQLQEIPIDRFSIRDSRFTAGFGVIHAGEFLYDLVNHSINLNGSINGLPLRGNIDMESLTEANRSELYLGKGKIIATGGLKGGKLDINLTAESFDLKELAGLCPENFGAEGFDGKADFSAEITGTINNPKVRGSAEYFGTKFYGYPIERASANISYSNKRITVSNIQASALGIPIQGEIAAAFRANDPVSLMIKLEGSETTLTDLDKIIGIPELNQVGGKVSVLKVNISGHPDELSGFVSFNAPRISYGGRSMTDIRARVKFSGGDKASVDGKFTFEDSPGYLSGNVASALTAPDMNLTAKIASLDIKRIETMIPDAPRYKLGGTITASANINGRASSPTVTGELRSPKLFALGYEIMRPSVKFALVEKKLVLTKTEGTLNGMPINITGTISDIPSSSSRLNINATMRMTLSSLEAYMPGIASWDLNGRVNAGLKITGDVSNPSVSLLVTSPKLEALGIISAENLELTTSLDGDLTALIEPEHFTVNVATTSIMAGGVTFEGANASLSRNGDEIMLGGLNARSGKGMLTGAGAASLTGSKPLDVSFMFTDIPIDSLSGKISGTLKISGQNKNPDISLKSNIPSLNVKGITLENVAAELSGNAGRLELNNVRANAWGAEIVAAGNIQLVPSVKASVTLTGRNMNLAGLLRDAFGAAMNGKISGLADFKISADGEAGDLIYTGTMTAKSLKAFGLSLSDVNIPFLYSQNTFSSIGSNAKFYGGTTQNNITLNFEDMTFFGDLEASSVDIGGLMQDLCGGYGWKVTGNAGMSLNITGSAKDVLIYEGGGQISASNGNITGAKWLDLLTEGQTHSTSYANIYAPFQIETGKLTLLSGSYVNAPDDEGMYKYVRLTDDGVINFGGGDDDVSVDMMTEGSFNSRIIRAIGGGIEGGENFSTVTFRVRGKSGSLMFYDVKMPQPQSQPQKPRAQSRPKSQPKKQTTANPPATKQQDPKKIDLSNSNRILRIWGSGK